MNILLSSLKDLFKPRDDDALSVDLTKVQQTNVPSRPRPQGSMPSTRSSEVTASSKSAVLSRKVNPKNGTKAFLDQHDHLQQDPIEVSDGEDVTEIPPKRSSRPRLTNSSASQPPQSHSTRKDLNKRADEERLLVDYGKKPADAVSIQIPTGPADASVMPKTKFHTGGLRPMNTFERGARPAPSSKESFYETNVSAGRTSTLPSTATNSSESKRKPPSLPRQSEPPKKKARTDEGSPDILQASVRDQGSSNLNLKLQSRSLLIHDLSSSPPSAQETRQATFSKDPQAGQGYTTVDRSPKKLRAPWSTPGNLETIPSRVQMVMSDEDDENSFTKNAAQQRRHGEGYDDGRGKKVKGAAKMPASTSAFSAQQRPISPSQRMKSLDKIIPNDLLRVREEMRSSPDIIQEDAGNNSQTPRRTKMMLERIEEAKNMARRTSRNYDNPAHVKLYRAEQMIFGSALDVSGYVLAVDTANRCFSIDYDSTLLNRDSLVSKVPVDRIHKVIHGKQGLKVKITTATIPGVGHEMLLELTSHKLVCELSLLLQSLGNGINTKVTPDDRLDRMFEIAIANAKTSTMRNLAMVANQTAAVSPYFDSNKARKVTDRQHEFRGDRTMADSSLEVRNGFNRDPEPRERRSGVANRQHELQEDLNERAKPTDLYVSSTAAEVSTSRSRTTRLTSAFRSSPPPPPLKYSQTGELGEPWKKPLVYPTDGKKRATVNFDDISRLDDDEFLNDNLIAFFLRYLEYYLEQEQPELSKRSYFFNSYFYEKLRQKPIDKKSTINYEGVKKWTDKIDLFSRDFVVVPVNENLHWYLAIICNLSWFKLSETEQDVLEETEKGEDSLASEKVLATETAHDTQQSLQELSIEDRELHGDILVSDLAPDSSGKSSGSGKKKGRKRKSEPRLVGVSAYKPAIITLDSLGLARYPAVSALKHYIAQEASVRLGKEIDVADIQGISAKKIPLQRNFSDCGLFVCAYLERFVVNPTTFVKQELGRIPQQWPKLHSHDLRSVMRDFIMDLHESQEGRAPEKAIPDVGGILLPPITPPRPALSGALADEEVGDSTLYDPPTSPEIPRGRQSREDGQRDASVSEDDPITFSGDHGPRYQEEKEEEMSISDGYTLEEAADDAFGRSLKARAAEMLKSPVSRRNDTVPESDSEPEVIPPPKDHPSAMAKRMREERSPKPVRKVRSNSSAFSDFLQGTKSYENLGNGADEDSEMLL